MNFCKVSEHQITKVKYGQFLCLLPSGLVLFQPVNSCSLRLILWPCYFEVTTSTPLCTVISAYMAVEGLAMLLSWPASQSELPSPHLAGAHRQGSSCPIQAPRWLWRFITGGLQLLVRIAVPQGVTLPLQRCFISKTIRDVLIQTRLFLPQITEEADCAFILQGCFCCHGAAQRPVLGLSACRVLGPVRTVSPTAASTPPLAFSCCLLGCQYCLEWPSYYCAVCAVLSKGKLHIMGRSDEIQWP